MFEKFQLRICLLFFFLLKVFTNEKIQDGNNLCSKHCLSYYDGCNSCGCRDNKPSICTQLRCNLSQYHAPICQECEPGYSWNDLKRECEIIRSCPLNCNLYSDGCNDCSCASNGDFLSCTQRQCVSSGIPECLQCENGYEWDANTESCEKKCANDCDIYFDGCNDYYCIMDDNGYQIINKTSKFCPVYKSPYCRICHNNLKWNECGSACTPTCENPDPGCTLICVPRCECPKSYPLLEGDYCIKQSDCP